MVLSTKKFVLASHPQGLPKLLDFKIVKKPLRVLNDGEILCKAEYLTVDPYMRGRMDSMKIGDKMVGEQIARVVKSRCPDFPEGTIVVGFFGWKDWTIYKVPPKEKRGFGNLYKIPDLKDLPLSYALGCCGMPGNTAYFGLTRICDPEPGDTVVISAAAGAVGSMVGQLAKMIGCTIIGFTGSDEKVKWLKELGFDYAFNYKTVDVHKTLQEHVPNGVDCYFDNVGGELSYHVARNMNENGRIAICGSISQYNKDKEKEELPMVPFDYMTLVYNQIRMEGFIVNRWKREWFVTIKDLRDWILEGKIKVQETIVEGFESLPQAFIDLLEGKNKGKMIVKVESNGNN